MINIFNLTVIVVFLSLCHDNVIIYLLAPVQTTLNVYH